MCDNRNIRKKNYEMKDIILERKIYIIKKGEALIYMRRKLNKLEEQNGGELNTASGRK